MSTTYKNVIGVVAGVVVAIGFLALSHVASAQENTGVEPAVRPAVAPLRERAEASLDALRAKREEVREVRSDDKKKLEEKRDLLRERTGERVASTSIEARAERVAKLEEKTRERAKAFAKRALERLSVATDRLSSLADRMDSRVTKLEESGYNLSKAKTLLAETRTHVAKAKTSIEEAKAKVDAATESGTATKESLAAVKDIVKTVETTVKDAHRALVLALREIKAGVSVRTNSATTTPTTE